MSIHAQKKGKRGEVEFCRWIDKNLNIQTEREYNQADGYSADIVIDDFLFEIKRRESLDLDSWWYQVVMSNDKKYNGEKIPVVAFRQNRQPWRFLLPGSLITGIDRGYVEMKEGVFIQFALSIIDEEN